MWRKRLRKGENYRTGEGRGGIKTEQQQERECIEERGIEINVSVYSDLHIIFQNGEAGHLEKGMVKKENKIEKHETKETNKGNRNSKYLLAKNFYPPLLLLILLAFNWAGKVTETVWCLICSLSVPPFLDILLCKFTDPLLLCLWSLIKYFFF